MAGHLFCYLLSISIVLLSIGYGEVIKPVMKEYFSAEKDKTELREHKNI